MKKTIIFVNFSIVVLALCSSLAGFSQTVNLQLDTVTWTADRFISSIENEIIEQESIFKTMGVSKIEWTQRVNSNEKVYAFDIQSTSGDWQNLNLTGTKIYQVKFGDRTGTLTFQRINSQVKVIFEFIVDGVNTMPIEFIVVQIQKQV